MTSFGYRSNPRYVIKKCSSFGTLNTRDCVCSIGTVEDKILVSKPLKNCARTNVVNAPREPYVVKQDNGSFVDKIIFDLNRAPDLPNQFHCFHCKDVLRDGEACKQCTYAKCRSGLGKGLCYICGHNQNSLNDSPSISETSSQSPPNINHCCYECGDPLDSIFYKRYTCKSCGKDAHIGYNCPSKVLVISILEPCNNQTIDELLQSLSIFHLTFHSEAESPFTLDSTPTYVDESPNVSLPVCYDDDDDEEEANSLIDNIVFELPPYEFIKSSVKNLVPIPSESEDESECDVPDCDDSQTTNLFSNPLFDDSTSSDDESSHEEDIHKMSFKTYSNPIFDFDEEIFSSEFSPIHNEDLESTLKNDRFDTEPYLLESLPNRDTLMYSPLKIDSLHAEFAGALIFLKSIPPGIDEADCDPEEDIHLVKRLLYDNSSPHPPEEIDLSFNSDDPMSPGIEEDDDDSERDIPILEELLDNYSLSLPASESYHFDIPSPYRPPAKPPDGNTGTVNIKMMGDVSDQKVPIPNLTITRVSNQEKSPAFLSHLGLEAFQPSAECPMMIINGKNIPLLDVPLFYFYPLDQFKYGGN
nr:hypothetical protein [Tanacetum cinerariifolium]